MNEEVPQINGKVPLTSAAEPADEKHGQQVASTGDEDTGARTPYFMPRRLGATAPHDCSNWSLDYRDGQEQPNPADPEQPIRTLEDENLVPQLNLLLDAGRRVAL
jgi:hypothetical protein